MLRTRTVLVSLLLATSAAAQDVWKEVESPHFRIVSNGPEKSTRQLAWRFEQFRALLIRLWPGARLDDGTPFTVFAAKDEATLASLAPQYWERKGYRPVSIYVGAPDHHYVALRLDVPDPDDYAMNPHFTAFRAYVTAGLASWLPRTTPHWLRRGLSEVHGNTVVREKEVHIGRPVTWHIERLRSEPRFRLADLVKVAADSREATDESLSRRFDASAWAFAHYISFGDRGVHAAKLVRFLQILDSGRPADAALQESLGDLDQYESGFGRYGRQLLFSYVKAELAIVLEPATLVSRPLGTAESAAARAGFHAAMGRPVEARAEAEAARRADPALPTPSEVEGRLLDRENRRDQARDSYLSAVEHGSRSSYVHYRAAQLLSQPEADRERLERAVRLLEKSVELNPAFGPAKDLLARMRGALETLREPARGMEPAVRPGERPLVAPVADVSQLSPVTVAVEFEVVDARGKRVDVSRSEVQLRQDGQPHDLSGFAFDERTGLYEARYVPRSGRPGSVSLQLLRPGANPRGPSGGPLSLRVLEALRPFETPLVAALDAPGSQRPFPLSADVLHFEQAPQGLHSTLVVEVPLRGVRVQDERAHVSLLARVRSSDGREMRRVALDSPIEPGPGERRRLAYQRVVWMTHLHLAPGRYAVEVAASDRLGDQIALVRRELVVPEPQAGLRLSSTVLLDPDGARASSDGGADEPLMVRGEMVVPSVEALFVTATRTRLPFFVAVYRDKSRSEPVELSFEMRRGGETVGAGTLQTLPPGDMVRYTNIMPLERLASGDYELKLVARQGESRAESTARFRMRDADAFLAEGQTEP